MNVFNMDRLINHGNRRGRQDALCILEAALTAADPYNNVIRLLRRERNLLIIGNPEFEAANDPNSGTETVDLDRIGRIYVVGAGKGVQRIAKAIEDVLGDRLTGGHVIGKHGDEIILKRIGVTLGAHPTPDENCAEGCRKILALAADTTENDLVFTIAANGISSLLTLPVDGIAMEEVKEMTRVMQIEKGAPTYLLNTIRNHIDQMKGGKLSKAFHPAKMIHLLGVDANRFSLIQPRHDYEYLMRNNRWLHNLPEGSTFEQAIETLRYFDAWESCPVSIRACLTNADPRNETVKFEEFSKMNFRVFGIMPEHLHFLPVAKRKAEELGYKAVHLCAMLQAEAKDAALTVGAIARSIEEAGEPFSPPVALFTTGELLVTVDKHKGVGGRNQEYVLTAATKIEGSKKIVFCAADTDGTDGPGGLVMPDAPNCLAGGIVDGFLMQEAAEKGVDIAEALKTHATSQALWKLDSGIHTGQNISLCDLGIVLVME